MSDNQKSLFSNPAIIRSHGFTLIELMIVIAIIAIILTLALPVYSNYTIRAKVGEGLSVAAAAKTAISAACVEDRSIAALNNTRAGYAFVTGTDTEDYVADIQASGPCTDPIITITTKNTGYSPAPVLVMTGTFGDGSGQVQWRCSSTSPDWLLPDSCRS